MFKDGIGNACNSSHCVVCRDRAGGRYTAELSFGGTGGTCYRLYEIDKDVFDLAGSFENDDYKTEKLIQEKGRELYRFEETRHTPPDETVLDESYRELCPWARACRSDK